MEPVPRPRMLTSHLHAVALSPPTYAENLASYSEGEAAWRIVRKLVETTACLTSSCLRIRRSWDMLRKMTTCVLPRFICVERYGPIFHRVDFPSRCESTSPAPSKRLRCQVGRSIPVRNVAVFPGGFYLRTLYCINQLPSCL